MRAPSKTRRRFLLLGPLSLLDALAGRGRTARYEYPAEPLVIG